MCSNILQWTEGPLPREVSSHFLDPVNNHQSNEKLNWKTDAFIRRTWAKGLIKATMHIKPASANNFATSAIRRIFSTRSISENPRFLFKPQRILSPSKQYAGKPLLTIYSSKAKLESKIQNSDWTKKMTISSVTYATVDFPAPDRPWKTKRKLNQYWLLLRYLPVNQTVDPWKVPRCPSATERFSRVIFENW